MSDGAANPAASSPDKTPGVSGRARLDAFDDREARQLMLRVGNGDYQSFETLYVRYHTAVYNFYLKLCRDRHLAEDGVQETFLRLWQAAGRYRPSAAFRTYLFQIAKNFWFNEREKLERRRALSLDGRAGLAGSAAASDANGAAPPLGDALLGATDDPAEQAQRREARDEVLAALAALDEKHRLVVVLSHFHGFRYREIAEILEIPEGTVKTRMFHAEKKLRAALGRRAGTGD